LTGSFKNLNELENHISSSKESFNKKITILFKEIYDEELGDYKHIIETIFCNE